MPSRPKLSLVCSYRRRRPYLDLLLSRLAYIRKHEGFTAFELIVAEGDTEPTVDHLAGQYDWVRYVYVPLPGIFNRSLLTNRGAAIAEGEYLMTYDVDLLPANGVLSNHLALAMSSPICLVSGYRLQLPEMLSDPVVIPEVNKLVEESAARRMSLVCPEDGYSSLVKYLLCGEKSGICTCYPMKAFMSIGGFDEGFVGWGSEDQDLMERLCDSGLALVRCYDLLYYHLPHEREEHWYDSELVEANRARFNEKRRATKSQ